MLYQLIPINSDRPGSLIPAVMWQGKAWCEERVQKREIQVKPTFQTYNFVKTNPAQSNFEKTNVKRQAEAKPRRIGILDQCFNWPGAAQNEYKDRSTDSSKHWAHRAVNWGRTTISTDSCTSERWLACQYLQHWYPFPARDMDLNGGGEPGNEKSLKIYRFHMHEMW